MKSAGFFLHEKGQKLYSYFLGRFLFYQTVPLFSIMFNKQLAQENDNNTQKTRVSFRNNVKIPLYGCMLFLKEQKVSRNTNNCHYNFPFIFCITKITVLINSFSEKSVRQNVLRRASAQVVSDAQKIKEAPAILVFNIQGV